MRGFGELESEIMDRMWSWGHDATVREVVTDLQREREIAYTTVMTVMDILHRKGWLTRERDGKAYRYTPAMSREEYTAKLMREALEDSGDREAVFAHFLDQIGEEESRSLLAVVKRLAGKRR